MSGTRHTAPLDQLVPRVQPGTAAQAAGVAPLADEGGELSPSVEMVKSDDFRAQVVQALTGTGVDPDRFLRVIETAMLERPAFLLCAPRLLRAALLRCAALGLEPNSPLGQVFLEPTEQEGTSERGVKLILGYRGMLKLIHRSPEIDACRVGVVRENDECIFEQGTNAMLMHRQALKERGDIVHLYVRWKLAGVDEAEFEIVTLEEIDERRQFAADPEGGAWASDKTIMMMKTALRIVYPWLPVSADAAAAVAVDEAMLTDDEGDPPAEP